LAQEFKRYHCCHPYMEPAEEDESAERPLKRARLDATGVQDQQDEFEELIGTIGDEALAPAERDPSATASGEQGRRAFADQLADSGQVTEDELPRMLDKLEQASTWGETRRWRSIALLLTYVQRSSRACRAEFVRIGMPVLGSLLQDSMRMLEADASTRQEAAMRALACLLCLRALPIGRATMWEHRATVGKAFDRLHRWCSHQHSALAAELRASTSVLLRRWKRQPKPAAQEIAKDVRGVRVKVVEMLSMGLNGIVGIGSPASPVPMASPGRLPPQSMAAEIEAALFSKHSGATSEYRAHARMLRTNLALPGNADLRARVLEGEVSVEDLVSKDSASLAPEALQAEREAAERRALQATVMSNLVPKRMDSEDRANYDAGTAPPPLVAPTLSSDSLKRSSSESGEPSSMQPQPEVPRPPVFLEPLPTPFLGGARPDDDRQIAGATPNVMATPAPEDDDEEFQALVRWFSAPVNDE